MTSVKPKVLPILDLIDKGTEYLKTAGISNAKLEIEWFLSNLLKCERIDLYVRFDEPLYPGQIDQLRDFLRRRKVREPFQYILGKAPFYGRDFKVTPDVLIPRPETELLIDILKTKIGFRTCLEVGTGSGCIGITALLETNLKEYTAIDISSKALVIAEKNALHLGAGTIQFIQMDFLHEIPSGAFDIILSNPPYVAKADLEMLEPELSFEPMDSLTDHCDGLTFYRRYAEVADQLLNQDGILLLEIGDHADLNEIAALYSPKGYAVHFHKDLKQIPRVVEISKC